MGPQKFANKMFKYVKSGISNRRTFSSLIVTHEPILSPSRVNSQRGCTRNISTIESMYLKLISLPAVHHIEDSFAYIHDTTGLPWWGSLVLSTALFRLVLTLPAHITQQKVLAKRYLLTQEMKNEILPAIQKGTDRQVIINKWSEEKAKRSFKRVAALVHKQKVEEYNCHFLKLFLPTFTQIPFWILASVGIRNMATLRHSPARVEACPVEERFIQMSAEGLFWCPNLSAPDPTFILPVLVGVTFASTIFVSSVKTGVQKEQSGFLQKYSRAVTGGLYGLSLVMIPISSYVPSAMALYWATSGAMGVLINLLLLHPPVRRAVRIPKIPSEVEEPYKILKEKIMNKKFL